MVKHGRSAPKKRATHRSTTTSTPIPDKLRHQVLDRDDHLCQRCGRAITYDVHSLQHRLPRGRGGQNTLSNLVTLCGSATTGCHGDVESHRAKATQQGWLVPSGFAPHEWPILRYSASGASRLPIWMLLTEEGWVLSEPHPTLQAEQRGA